MESPDWSSLFGAIGAAASIFGMFGGKPKATVIQLPPPPPVLAPLPAETGDISAQAQELRRRRGRESTILAGGELGGQSKAGIKSVLGG